MLLEPLGHRVVAAEGAVDEMGSGPLALAREVEAGAEEDDALGGGKEPSMEGDVRIKREGKRRKPVKCRDERRS